MEMTRTRFARVNPLFAASNPPFLADQLMGRGKARSGVQILRTAEMAKTGSNSRKSGENCPFRLGCTAKFAENHAAR
jgi:hypothetical protein